MMNIGSVNNIPAAMNANLSLYNFERIKNIDNPVMKTTTGTNTFANTQNAGGSIYIGDTSKCINGEYTWNPPKPGSAVGNILLTPIYFAM